MKRLLAATMSVAMLAGCADLSGTLNTAKVGSSAPITAAKPTTTSMPAAKTASTSAAQVKAANAAKITVGATTAVQSAAAAAQLESDIEGYNAIAEAAEASDSTVTSGYSLKALGTAQADARPSRGADAFDAWGLDGGTSPAMGRGGFGQGPAPQLQRQQAPDQQWQDEGDRPALRGGSRGNIAVSTTVVVINLPSRMPRFNPGQQIVIQTIAAKPAAKKGTGKQGKGRQEDNRAKKQAAAVPSAEAQAVKSLLALAHWNHDASDSTLLVKEATQELSHTDGKGGTVGRKIHLKRVVKAGTGELIEAFTDLQETLADGTTNNAHWEKTLQEDGSYHAVFHLEQNLADGSVKVTNWEKTIAANGDITGSGTTTVTDKNGVVVSSESLNLGGSTATQQTVDTSGTTTSSETTTTDAAATTTAQTTTDPAATTTTDPAATTATDAAATTTADAATN